MSLEIIALVNGVVAWLKSPKTILLTICIGCGSLLTVSFFADRLAVPWLILPGSLKLGLVIVLCFLLPLFAITAVGDFWLKRRMIRVLCNLPSDEKSIVSRVVSANADVSRQPSLDGQLLHGGAYLELVTKGVFEPPVVISNVMAARAT